MEFDDQKTVYTPEQIAITYRLAGVGTRFAAIALDSCIQGVLMAVVVILFLLVATGVAAISNWMDDLSELAVAVWVGIGFLLLFCLYWGYYVFFETVWHGQTPGKRVCGIRVMRDGGFPIDFRASFVRNILRAVDVLPSFYGVGALVMFISKESKRLGDYAAGTIVVAEARVPDVKQVAEAAAPAPVAVAVEYQVLGDPALLNLRAMTREQFAVVEHYLARRAQLAGPLRADLAKQIAEPLMTVVGYAAPTGEFAYERFLVELAIAYRGLSGT